MREYHFCERFQAAFIAVFIEVVPGHRRSTGSRQTAFSACAGRTEGKWDMFLRQEQGGLLEQLKRRDPLMADIYFGGLRAFADETNPYRFQLAAHAFRELIAHCLRMTGEKVVFGDGMKQRLVPVKNAYLALRKTSQLAPDPAGRPAGVSDDLIVALGEFFEWSDNNRPEARKKTGVMLTQLAGPGPALPSDVVGDEISAWMR